MAKEKPLSDRRSLFSQSNTSNYSNSVFSDFIRYSQTLTNRFVNPIKSGRSSASVTASLSPSPSPSPSSSPTPTPTSTPTSTPSTAVTRLMLYGGDPNNTIYYYDGNLGSYDSIYDENTSACYIAATFTLSREGATEIVGPKNDCNYPFPSPPSPSPIPNGTYSVGDSALGGKVAYILQPGDPGYDTNEQHGLIAANIGSGIITNYSNQRSLYSNDLYSYTQWGCRGTLITGANGTAIGTGNQNTIDIIAGCNPESEDIAASLSGGYYNSYNDWYLPSKDELNKLYLNKTAIGGFRTTHPSLNNCYYFSSTQVNATNAWVQDFNTGEQVSLPKRSYMDGNNIIEATAYYRPVRSF